MRFLAAVFAVALAACSSGSRQGSVPPPPTERASTLEIAFVDTIDNAPAKHLAVGGKLRVRVPSGGVTWANANGPFAVMTKSDDSLVITATGAGTGEIEIETTTGYARFAVSAAPIAKVGILFDAETEKRATVALFDAQGKRLVDASLRIAPGSAPVSFLRDAWDRIEFATLPPGDVFVKTDLIGATRANREAIAHSCSSAPRVI